MNTYQYTAKDKSGNTLGGLISAMTEVEVADTLHKKELVIVSVTLAEKGNIKPKEKDKRVKMEELVIFTRQLATMIDAGVPLVHALGILAEQIENKRMKLVVIVLREDIEAGMSFCDALARHPNVFSELFINMIKAGESSGALADVLNRLATYLEKSASLSRKIRSSMVYPTLVVSLALIITAVLMLKVVPTFKGMFETMGGTLPLPTRVLIKISDLFEHYFLLLVGLLVAVGFSVRGYIMSAKGRYKFDQFKLKAPVLGPLFRKLAIAKFSRTLSTLVRSGVSILSALDIVSKTSGNKVIEEAVIKSSRSVRDGELVSAPLSKSGVFPPLVCRMINIGEQTGQLEKMLSKIADFYDEQVDVATSSLTSMIEPLVIIFLGVFIGGIVISLFLPIFKISQLIAK